MLLFLIFTYNCSRIFSRCQQFCMRLFCWLLNQLGVVHLSTSAGFFSSVLIILKINHFIVFEVVYIINLHDAFKNDSTFCFFAFFLFSIVRLVNIFRDVFMTKKTTINVLDCFRLTVIGINQTHEKYQRFSIGFRSGERNGQSIVATLLSCSQVLVPRLAWTVALSCWKVKLTPGNCWTYGARRCPKTSWYPTPLNAPQTITLPPAKLNFFSSLKIT
uniref:Secreted protein n=1 Tax=Heterorhabditis bacteriophora TaxID=37862 RepID=A0A1I7WF96_HETBA